MKSFNSILMLVLFESCQISHQERPLLEGFINSNNDVTILDYTNLYKFSKDSQEIKHFEYKFLYKKDTSITYFYRDEYKHVVMGKFCIKNFDTTKIDQFVNALEKYNHDSIPFNDKRTEEFYFSNNYKYRVSHRNSNLIIDLLIKDTLPEKIYW